jgi:hypothetical protein
MPATTRYRIRLARMRLETMDVTIEEADDDAGRKRAQEIAVAEALGSLDKKWDGVPWDPGNYDPWVEEIASEGDAEANGTTLDKIFRVPLNEDEPDERHFNYLVLLADMDTGEGRVCWQPWFSKPVGLMEVDVGGDWIDAIGEVTGADISGPPTPSRRWSNGSG